jgi:hypothetical protein
MHIERFMVRWVCGCVGVRVWMCVGVWVCVCGCVGVQLQFQYHLMHYNLCYLQYVL